LARYTDSVCRLCRREGIKLFLKGTRCETPKCAIDRRAYAPGQHGQGRSKPSEYGLQLREKQKVRRIYGILEKQFRRYFAEADRKKGVTGETLLQLLETRMDNVIYRLGLAASRNAARQLVLHRFFTVNGRRVNVPSFNLKKGDVISVAQNKRARTPIQVALENMKGKTVPAWLSFDPDKQEGLVQALPTRDEITLPVQEQLIVELYSR